MSTNVKTSNAFFAATQLETERKILRNRLYSTFQGLTDYLKATYGENFEYVRRRTYVGPRVANTKFCGANWGNDATQVLNCINTRYKGVLTAKVTGPNEDSITVFMN